MRRLKAKFMKQKSKVTNKVTEGLVRLAEIYKTLHVKRMNPSALLLASPEVKFKLAEPREKSRMWPSVKYAKRIAWWWNCCC